MTDDQAPMSTAHAQQLAYHLRTAAVLSLNGEEEESLSEVLLSWLLLGIMIGDLDAAASRAALTSPLPLSASVTDRHRAADRTRALALELQAHFVSLGRSEEAELYHGISEVVEESLDRL